MFVFLVNNPISLASASLCLVVVHIEVVFPAQVCFLPYFIRHRPTVNSLVFFISDTAFHRYLLVLNLS